MNIRDAATLILVRDGRILMGQRGEKAAFMPSKFVFPGGAVDPEDFAVPLATDIAEPCRSRLTEETRAEMAAALQAAAIRELWEEAGLILGHRGAWSDTPPPNWAAFAETGHLPDASAMRFVFRAVTPAGRPRRFDARFFLVDASAISGDPDDFSRAEDELSHLRWVPFEEVRALDLPFITEVVLAEIAPLLLSSDAPASVPFFRNDDEQHLVSRLGGRSPLSWSGDPLSGRAGAARDPST
ncbi:NUDIX hydrolase [Aestuariibius sp. 2305UL40-4]|uniref:NUDIX hydrolase n=1 Tax=Aestuariibius violaceus TaxID=3234132 RepID=UPI00345E5287